MTPELTKSTERACADIPKVVQAMRDAMRAVNDAVRIAAEVQREGQDAEYQTDEVSADERSHLDGNLLQRTAAVATIAADLQQKLRLFGRALQDFSGDCKVVCSGEYAGVIATAQKRLAERDAALNPKPTEAPAEKST